MFVLKLSGPELFSIQIKFVVASWFGGFPFYQQIIIYRMVEYIQYTLHRTYTNSERYKNIIA